MAKQQIKNATGIRSINGNPDQADRSKELEPREEIVAKLAYQLWSDRGRPEGSPEEDWFRAENLLRVGAEPMVMRAGSTDLG